MAAPAAGRLDVLVLDLIGKDVSGTGMDPNVIGRCKAGDDGPGPRIGRIVVRDLTRGHGGQRVGIGLADVVLRRAAERRPAQTYMNGITAKDAEGAKIPLDRGHRRGRAGVALAAACGHAADRPDRPGPDTKHLELLYVSEPALSDALATGRCEVVEPPGRSSRR